MSNLDIITYVICNAFLNKTNKNPILPSPKNIEIRIPKGTFGVFVTVRENGDRLYGCIGNFDLQKRFLETKVILEQVKELSYKSANEDERFQNRDRPLVENVDATFEVSFMQSPTMEINRKTGMFLYQNRMTKYQNDKFGIIYIADTGKTTTFLPNVFPNGDWSQIQLELKKKSGTRGNLYGKFLAFTTAKTKNSIRNTIFSDAYLDFYITNSVKTITKYFQELNYVPYSLKSNGQEAFVNKNEYVRNIATLYDLLRFNLKKDQNLFNLIITTLKDIKPFIIKSLSVNHAKRTNNNSLPGYSAIAFYLLCLTHLYHNQQQQGGLIRDIKNFLFQNIVNMEHEFELPECLIALCYVSTRKDEKKILLHKLHDLLEENQKKEQLIRKIKEGKKQKLFKNESDYKIIRGAIFQKNWISKYIYTLYIKQIGLPDDFKENVTSLKKEMISFKKYFQDQYMETNEIAVCFEGLCSLLYITPFEKDDRTFDQIWNLFLELNCRMKDFLFYFIQDKTFRIDITGHVLNGIYVLYMMNKSIKQKYITST